MLCRVPHFRRIVASPSRTLPLVRAAKKRSRKTGLKMNFTQGLNVAVEGCCHGEMDIIYATLKRLEETEGVKIDLLICCGDFQAVRNLDDLECMSVPDKYKRIMTFYKYYNGTEKAPYPTVFIGGNHEASNYLRELHYGGWVAPNIYFMGTSGVVNFGGIRIAGLSGIYNHRHYNMGYCEKLPYNEGTKRSIYHVRAFDVFKLKQIKQKVDVLLSHDWPDCITDWGNKEQLIQTKPFFRKEIGEGTLGSPAASELLHTLQPDYYFAAHLHVKFPALVHHGGGTTTRFLALDKCLPRRDFLQTVNFPKATGPKVFSYDREWLSIVKRSMPLISFGQRQPPLLSLPDKDIEAVEELLDALETLKIPQNFVKTAEGYEGENRGRRMPRVDLRNPQTEQLLDMLHIPHNLHYGNQRNVPTVIPDRTDEDVHSQARALEASFITFGADEEA